MNIIDVNLINESNTNNVKLENAVNQLQTIIDSLNKMNLSDSLVTKINTEISLINTSLLTPNALIKFIKAKQRDVLRSVEKEAKIVPKFYYRNMWLGLGMSTFGIPLGVAIGLSLGNIGLLGVGLPIGLGLGAIVGMRMDKKAYEEGRQIDVITTT